MRKDPVIPVGSPSLMRNSKSSYTTRPASVELDACRRRLLITLSLSLSPSSRRSSLTRVSSLSLTRTTSCSSSNAEPNFTFPPSPTKPHSARRRVEPQLPWNTSNKPRCAPSTRALSNTASSLLVKTESSPLTPNSASPNCCMEASVVTAFKSSASL